MIETTVFDHVLRPSSRHSSADVKMAPVPMTAIRANQLSGLAEAVMSWTAKRTRLAAKRIPRTAIKDFDDAGEVSVTIHSQTRIPRTKSPRRQAPRQLPPLWTRHP